MDWTTQYEDHDGDGEQILESPQIPRATSSRGGARRTAVLLVGGLVLIAAIGGSGFIIGHYMGNTSTPPAIGRTFPRNGNSSGGFGNFFPGGNSGSAVTPTTPTTLPANAPSTSAAAKIAAKVDVGVVDITTQSSYSSSSAAGTGMILSSNGLILTNNHVIDGATSIKVRIVSTNTTYTASVLGYSVTSDVALLQLKDASGLTPVTTANSNSVKATEAVVGVGNAGGVGGTPSYAPGAVVATNQSLTASDPDNLTGAEKLTGMIQIAASIQPGDSGGPLVNTDGQVIGMDTAGSSSGSGYGFSNNTATNTQGYAIPINAALAIARTIESGTSTSRVHVGATPILGIEISPTLSGYGGFGSSPVTGVQISGLATGTSAASSALAAGDVITALNGQSVTTTTQLSTIVQNLAPGAVVKVSYTTPTGASSTTNVTLVAGPAL